MPSSYTSSLRLTLPATGELSGTWGTTVNTGITELTDAAIAGYLSIAMTDADYTLTVASGATDQARRMMLNMTGSLSVARNVICPSVSKLYVIKNSTTNGFAITLKTFAGTGISVPNGKTMFLLCNGTDVVDAITNFSALTLGAALPATSGGTGQSSYAVGDIVYADTTTTLSKLADVATGNSLISGGVGVAPSWGKIGLTTHVSGTLPVANGGTGITSFGTGIATWLGTPSSANLAAAVTDETGSGALVFGTSPTITSASLVTPALGTPASGNFSTGTFTWPTFNQNTTGTAAGLSVTLVATSGGTGQSSYAVGDLLYASTTTALSKLADVATGNSLISGGVGVAPSWGKIGLTTHVSGTLPVANGGTGITSFGTGVATWLGTPSSANLAAAVTDETGSGALVFGTSPTITSASLVTPALGTPASGNFSTGTFTWPTFNQNTTGTAAGLSATLVATSGGTGQSSYAIGDLLYASTSTALSKLADVATGNSLISGGVGVAPSWGKIGLTTHVTGTLPVANGGTGITSLGTGVATWLGTPSSANLAAAVTDETGSGALVFGTSPTIASPTITGTASFVNLSYTGTLTGGTGVINIGTGQINKDASGNVGIGTATNTNASLLTVNGTISETVASTQWLIASQYDVGTAPNEIPLNGFLGDLAFQNRAAVSLGAVTATSVAATTITENAFPVISQADIGNDPNDLSLNYQLGDLAFQNSSGLVLSPPASAAPAGIGQMVFELTSNTSLTIRVKGSDGTVRSVALTLA